MAEEKSSEIIFREIPKNQSEIIRISRSEHNGHLGINVRVWYLDTKTEAYLPTKKGIWIPIKHVPDVLEAVTGALAQINEGGA